MLLRNKVILIISSEAWGKIFISKHHYALTLAERGNKVFFLNPINFELVKGEIRVEPSAINKNLCIITYRPFFPWILKFHFKWLYEILIKIQIKKVLQILKTKIDIVWDFNCSYLYNDLSIFNADIKIFHPVDKISVAAGRKKADLFLSVSPLILKDYIIPNVPKFLINHGLSKNFEELAYKPPELLNYNNRKIKVCYIGNLLIPSLDRETLKKLILNHKEIDFFFIGPYSLNENNIYNKFGKDDEIFISFLKNCLNVRLRGILTSKEISDEINNYDAFLICYKNSDHYQSDNSHKILEYLCTGKVVISTPILFYKGLDLIEMSNNGTDLPELFDKVIRNFSYYNSLNKMASRKLFAMNNTYSSHIAKIENLI